MGTPVSDALAERFRKGFTADCATIDALARNMKRRGVALLFDEKGNLEEIVDLNGGSEHIEVSNEGNKVHVAHSFPEWNNAPARTEKQRGESERIMHEGAESYSQMGGEEWKKAAARSHEVGKRTEGHFEPQVHEGARTLAKKQPTGDAARLAKENAAKEKAYRADAIARNERIFAAMKERSTQIHR